MNEKRTSQFALRNFFHPRDLTEGVPWKTILAFAFPMLYRLLAVMGLINISLFAIITVGGFLVFAALYALMYKLTSHSYYQLVKS